MTDICDVEIILDVPELSLFHIRERPSMSKMRQIKIIYRVCGEHIRRVTVYEYNLFNENEKQEVITRTAEEHLKGKNLIIVDTLSDS